MPCPQLPRCLLASLLRGPCLFSQMKPPLNSKQTHKTGAFISNVETSFCTSKKEKAQNGRRSTTSLTGTHNVSLHSDTTAARFAHCIEIALFDPPDPRGPTILCDNAITQYQVSGQRRLDNQLHAHTLEKSQS